MIMKKLVIKTACFTLAGVFVLSTIIYFIIGAVSPKTLASFYSQMGNYNLSVKYLEKTYQKSQDDSDLLTLCFVVDECKSSSVGKKYLDILVGSDKFFDLCSSNVENAYSISDADYMVGKLALCHYYESGINSAISYSKLWVKNNGYTTASPFYILMMSDLSLDSLQTIESELIELSGTFNGEGLTNLQKDLSLVQKLVKG